MSGRFGIFKCLVFEHLKLVIGCTDLKNLDFLGDRTEGFDNFLSREHTFVPKNIHAQAKHHERVSSAQEFRKFLMAHAILPQFSRPLRDWSAHSSLPSTACWAIIRASLRDFTLQTAVAARGLERNAPRTERLGSDPAMIHRPGKAWKM